MSKAHLTITQFTNVGSPRVGDFVIIPGCAHGCHNRIEGYVVDVDWVVENHSKQYNSVTVLDTVTQTRHTVKHTVFLDETAPEGAINWFY